ncbi:MATE family efflux transporter [Clostridium transplantifaecale]|uniref:MATE family efflux transporter n=1 Tax=Clostridium transplantifaecale TaxID=2479838 RepID=UPI000F62CC0B|nr:MATE family efflux transporter [Clostridium transplantifaecale]
MDGATLAISVGTIVTVTSSFIRQPINGFCQGLQPVISYNFGAGKHERVRQAIKCSILITTAYAAVLWLFMMVVPGRFSQMFTESGDVIGVSMNLIRIYIFGMIFAGVQSTLIQSFVARGMKKQSLFVSAFSKCLYVPFLLILPAIVKPAFSMPAIYGAQAITDVIGVLFIVILYKKEQRTGMAI